MISLELAQALRDAGLKREFMIGDSASDSKTTNPIWLPRLDQLLDEIEKRGYAYVVHSKDFHITEDYVLFECYLIDDTSMHKSFRATTIKEAAAQALLWILKEGQE